MNQTPGFSVDRQTTFTILQQFLSEHPVFGALEDMEIRELSGAVEILALPAEEILFRQGDPGDGVYLVLAGSLEARIRAVDGSETLVGRLFKGDIVGEIALMTGQSRMATIFSLENTRLAWLPDQGLSRLINRHPRMIEELSRHVLPRFRHTQLVNILMGLFGEIELPAFQEIEDQLVWKHLLSGEVLFRQGEPADSFYVVVSGRLRVVVKDGERDERIMGELGRGEFTGEFGLLTREPRSATVFAVRETEVVQFSQSMFDHLLTRHAPALLHLTRLIVQRVARFNQSQTAGRPAFSAISVVPTDPSAPVEEFSASLFESLSRYGTVLSLNSRSFDDLYNRQGAAQTSAGHPNDGLIQGWLAEKESQYSFILYQADRTFTPWTRRCLSQSDRILWVGQVAMSPAPGEIEQMSAGMNLMARQDLALLHPQNQNCASETKQWLDPRHVNSYFHVRPDIPQDFQRLARRLAGKATGLVLGGGGARGWAHLGVIQALEDAGVEIDLIGGTSMGALISAGYAYGYSSADIHNFARTFSRPEKLLDYTLPFASLTASRKVTALMRQLFGSAQIEDLYLPFFCVSSNLTRAEPMIHRTGPLWESVRASLAIPGIFTPMPFGTDVLVDGGVLNNFPIDIMRELCEGGYVIGVNVAPKQERYKNFSFGPSISGWQVLWEKIFPFGKRLNPPSILSSLMRTTEINGLYKLRFAREQADLIIEPPVGQFGSLDFSKALEIIAIGYQAARDIEIKVA